MDQDEQYQETGRVRGHSKSGNNENRNERTTPKGQPARVVLKSNSSTSKATPRITLRTQNNTKKGFGTLRETPPSRKESSPGTRKSFTSLRTTPGSGTKDLHPQATAKTTIRENSLQPVKNNKAGQHQQVLTRTPPSIRAGHRVLKQDSIVMRRKLSGHSEEGSDWTLTPIPKPASLHEDAFTAPNSPDISSGDEMDITTRIGDSPFHADCELSGDDLESRMRSFLRRRERGRASRRSEIKSVKWDPAIVACGPLAHITNKPKQSEDHAYQILPDRKLEEPTKDLENSLDNLNRIAADLKKADRRILQQLLEALKTVDSSDDTTVIRRKKTRFPLGEQNVEHNQTTTSTSPDHNNTRSTAKGLNPEAPVYRNFAPEKARFFPQKENKENKENIPQGGKWPLNVQRKRPHTSEDAKNSGFNSHDLVKPNKYIPPALRTRKAPSIVDKEIIEPIWIKTAPPYSVLPSQEANDQSGGIYNSQEPFLDARLDPVYALPTPTLAQQPRVPLDNQPILPPSWMVGFPTTQHQHLAQAHPMIPLGFFAPYAGFSFQPNTNPNPATSPDWYTVPMVPFPTVPAQHEQFPNPPIQRDKDYNDRVKRLPVNVIPNETEPGRTATTLEPAWATQVLDKFTAKYPKTGTKKPLPKPTKEKNVATKIQQRLEVLLLYQKEKKAMEEKFGHAAGLSFPRQPSLVSSHSSSTDSIDVSLQSP
ncbi:hypothetical protein ONS95_006102 [Cadophora gregata]|uniref:uncharacterized protein n=1 Tax=Cadophora gregata TaxID=51156 RepID=UPI0026DA9584|nr:uncharacterized protein ONS95_006102 [Cadophora gregata]KAK0102486.1 hypothetical protein ONS95_006102 [Cadophora gregata]KAK0104115.1 hypothetical protein ONS96_005211 [Cadophora gregata f. sp. sojae]